MSRKTERTSRVGLQSNALWIECVMDKSCFNVESPRCKPDWLESNKFLFLNESREIRRSDFQRFYWRLEEERWGDSFP